MRWAVHAHRDALGEADPLEGGADGGQEVAAGAAVALRDALADAVDAALQRPVRIGHQREFREGIPGNSGTDHGFPD
jgi:hypothetical protein